MWSHLYGIRLRLRRMPTVYLFSLSSGARVTDLVHSRRVLTLKSSFSFHAAQKSPRGRAVPP